MKQLILLEALDKSSLRLYWEDKLGRIEIQTQSDQLKTVFH